MDTKKNTFEQICSRQEQLKKDKIKTNIEKKIIVGFPPIGLSIISKIILNQNNILISNNRNLDNKDDNLYNYLKITYCVPTITKNSYQEKTQS
jgi:hypothetical protein